MILSEKTKLTFTIGNLITLVTTIFFIAGVWYHLDAQIEEAKTLPKQKNDKITFRMLTCLIGALLPLGHVPRHFGFLAWRN